MYAIGSAAPLRSDGADRRNMITGMLERDGFAIVPDVLDAAAIQMLVSELQNTTKTRKRQHALRDLLSIVPAIGSLAESPALRALIEPVLGPAAFAVRGLLFDKVPEANWKVAWRQDLTIAVRERHDVPGFSAWSIKDGIQHVQPPSQFLEKMLTLRVQLDESSPENGPLKVLPGTHRLGRLCDHDVDRLRSTDIEEHVCLVPRGGVLLMRPLLLHASSAAQKPSHRRVIHLEFAAEPLPGGLQWHAPRPRSRTA